MAMASLAVRPLRAENVRLHNKGEKLNLLQTLKLIKEGVPVISNARIDPFLEREKFSTLSEHARKILGPNETLTSTLFIKAKQGEKLGEKTVFSEDGRSIIGMVPKIFQNEPAIACELTGDKFELQIKDDGAKTTLTLLTENDVMVFEPAPVGTLGKANASTCFIPATKVSDGNPAEERYSHWSADASVSLIARAYDAGYPGEYSRRYVFASRRSFKPLAVLVEGIQEPVRTCPIGNEFIFKMPDGKVIGKAGNMFEFMEIVEKLNYSSLRFHVEKGHFSPWLEMIGENKAAEALRAIPTNLDNFNIHILVLQALQV